MIEVFVESIRVNTTNYKRVVMLKEKAGERYVPIWVGHFEADAIAIPMQNIPVNRPLTHDLLGSAITALGGTVTRAGGSMSSRDRPSTTTGRYGRTVNSRGARWRRVTKSRTPRSRLPAGVTPLGSATGTDTQPVT